MIRRRATSHSGAPTGRLRAVAVRPRRTSLGARLAWGLTFLVVGSGLLWLLWPVFSILFASAVFAYLLDPLVDRIERRGHSREVGIGILFGAAVLALALVGLIVIPAVAAQFQELAGNVKPYFDRLGGLVGPGAAWVEARTGVKIPLDFASLQAEVPNWLARLSPDVRKRIQQFLGGLFTSSIGFVSTVVNLALLPLFTFYLLRDWDKLMAYLRGLIPPRDQPLAERLAGQVDERLSAFVRGQITVCLILGVVYSSGLWISRVDLAFVIGMLSGVLFIVPYLGTVVGVVLAAILCLMKHGVDWHLIGVAATFGGGQLLEGFVLTPLIVGDKVGLHPLVVMIALIVGGSLLGIWGMLLAIPVTAVLSVVGAAWLEMYRKSAVYGSTK